MARRAPEPAADRRWAVLAVLVLTTIAYLPALRGPLLWNDKDYVTRPDLRNAAGIARIWFEPGATEQYYPVLHSAFWIEHRLWGNAALGYHLANVLLHALSACLFALVLRRLAARPGAGSGPGETPSGRVSGGIGWEWIAALIFALHPVCVESVAWISEQKNTLSTVFYLSAAWLYLRREDAESGRPPLYLAATLAFVLAVLAKSVAATLPGALLVALWWRRGRLAWRRDVAPLVPWFVVGAAGGLFTAWVERRYIGAAGPAFELGFAPRVLIAGKVVWFYLGKLLWPAGLVFIYPRWTVNPASWRAWLFPLGVAAAVAGTLVIARSARGERTARAPLATLLFFVGSLFPVLGFLNIYAFVFSFVADHFQYVAMLGPIALATSGLEAWSRRRREGPDRTGRSHPWPEAIAAIAICVLGVLTWRQSGLYRSPRKFYEAIVARNPASAMAQNNLGIELDREGREPEAIARYEAALQLRPDDPDVHNNLGVDLSDAGRLADAAGHFEKALRLRPEFLEARVNLANALRKEGRLTEAIDAYEEVLRLRPDYPESRKGLGLALAAAGRYGEAVTQYLEALKARPGSAETLNNLGLALMAENRLEEAIAAFRSALSSAPSLLQARLNLGVALTRANRPAEAMRCYSEALRIRPDYAEAHNNLGLLFARMGRMEAAVAEFRAAVRSDGGYADAHHNLGVALQASGDLSGGVEQLKEAEALKAR